MAFRKGFVLESLENKKSSSSNKKNKPKSESTERLTLKPSELLKLDRWVSELNQKFNAMIRLTKSDLANFLIRQHPDTLSDSEVAQIENENFDEVRWLNWALNQIRSAKKDGQILTLNDLMTKRQLEPNPSPKTSKRKRSNQNESPINPTPSISTPATDSAVSAETKKS